MLWSEPPVNINTIIRKIFILFFEIRFISIGEIKPKRDKPALPYTTYMTLT